MRCDHVEAKPLTDSQRAEYFERVAGLVDVASAATVDEFRRRLAMEALGPSDLEAIDDAIRYHLAV